MTEKVQNIVPNLNDVINQKIYRQLSVGWTPFMGMFHAAANKALSYGLEGRPKEGEDVARFQWGPTMGTGKVWGFADKMDLGYMSSTALPFVHWLYGGGAATWALQQLAINGTNIQNDYGVKFNTPAGLKQYLVGSKVKGGKTSGLLGMGLTKPGDIREQFMKTKGGKFVGSNIMSQRLSKLGNTSDKIEALEELFGSDFTADEFASAAREGQLPDNFGGKWKDKAKTLSGPPNAEPTFRKNRNWRVPQTSILKATKWLQENLAGNVEDLYNDSDEKGGLDINERKIRNIQGESGEERGLATLEQRYDAKSGHTWSPSLPRQFQPGAKVGQLPEGIAKNRQNVDISTKGAEGEFVYHLRENNNTLKEVIKMSQETSVGIEITADDLADKGGYADLDLTGDTENIINEIAEFNTKIIDEMQKTLTSHSQNLDNAVTALTDMSGASDPSKNPLGFQARQTSTRLLDAASDNNPLTEGFEFTAPFNHGNSDYMASWGFTIHDENGGPAGLVGPYKIGATKPTLTALTDGSKLFLDIVGVAAAGSWNSWQGERDALFDDLLFNQLARRGAQIDGLIGQWSSGGLSPYTDNNIYPTTTVGFKMPYEIAKDIQDAIKTTIEAQTSDAEFMSALSQKSVELSRQWKSAMGSNVWEGSKAYASNDGTFGTSSAASSLNQWMLPSIMLGGTAASAGLGKGTPGQIDEGKAWTPF
tara:strand:+ start:994 stop:3108 length:2115 start_codon:yes stop_codon:yes gene_type:complete